MFELSLLCVHIEITDFRWQTLRNKKLNEDQTIFFIVKELKNQKQTITNDTQNSQTQSAL